MCDEAVELGLGDGDTEDSLCRQPTQLRVYLCVTLSYKHRCVTLSYKHNVMLDV